MTAPTARLIQNLVELAKLEGGNEGNWAPACKTFAAATGMGYHGFYEILTGVKLPSGQPKSVGGDRAQRIERAYGPTLPSGWFYEENAIAKYLPQLRFGPDPLPPEQVEKQVGKDPLPSNETFVTTFKTVPSLDLATLGEVGVNTQYGPPGGFDSLVIPGNFGSCTFKAQIADNSMSPDLRQGDAIVVDPALADEAMTEDMVVVRAQTNDRVFVGWYFERIEGGFFVKPINRAAPEVDGEKGRLKVLGVVIDRVLRGRTSIRKAA